MADTGIESKKQLRNWFVVNNQKWFWQPRVIIATVSHQTKNQILSKETVMATTTVEEAKDKIWNIVQVISTTEQQITRQSKKCSKNAVVCVLGNWNVCKVCQQEKFGG